MGIYTTGAADETVSLYESNVIGTVFNLTDANGDSWVEAIELN